MPLIQTLPDGKLDIIGDVHGHFEALQNLLHYLGYSPEGKHPQGRKLVFVGDLIDRGPQSPEMLEWYRQAHQAGYAYMVLGNHEINLLTNEPKDGSGWFFHNRADKDDPLYAPWQKLPDKRRQAIISLLKSQPLILQRADLRIVHAAWHEPSVQALHEHRHDDPVRLYHDWDDEIRCHIKHAPWFDDYLCEQKQYAHDWENPCANPPALPATAQHDSYRSTRHPIRALTCGTEEPITQPFFASGRWRFTLRTPWWEQYHDPVPVVIGHYWRQWHTAQTAKHRIKLFTVPAHHWHGARKNVFCCDFSVGARWRDRKKNISPSHSAYRLAALRWPEKTLVFDNGDTLNTEY